MRAKDGVSLSFDLVEVQEPTARGTACPPDSNMHSDANRGYSACPQDPPSAQSPRLTTLASTKLLGLKLLRPDSKGWLDCT